MSWIKKDGVPGCICDKCGYYYSEPSFFSDGTDPIFCPRCGRRHDTEKIEGVIRELKDAARFCRSRGHDGTAKTIDEAIGILSCL